MRPGRGLLPPYRPKGVEVNGENDRGGWGRRRGGGGIFLLRRKVGNLGNLGRTAGYIHRAPLFKSGRVQNLGVVTYSNVDEQDLLHITILTKGKEEKRGRRIFLMLRKVGKMVNLGRTTGYIYRAPLVKSGREQNLGGVTYEKFDEQGRLHITVLTKGNE